MAWTALGVAGIIAVVIAGWTTSNPTLYRAGLAMQAITPGWPRWAVTAAVGTVTTIIACFPFVFTKLLDFVGLYGLLLVPIGSIVFTEHWIFPRIGLTQLWAEKKGVIISWPALISWFAGLGFALWLNYGMGVSLFYLFLPTWFVAMFLYIALASVMGARETYPESESDIQETARRADEASGPAVPPKPAVDGGPVLLLARVFAIGALVVCAAWPIWIFTQGGEGFAERFATFRTYLIVPTIIYFIAGTVWAIKRDKA
jgi:NCS1 family nucleobase:cation symporter-1